MEDAEDGDVCCGDEGWEEESDEEGCEDAGEVAEVVHRVRRRSKLKVEFGEGQLRCWMEGLMEIVSRLNEAEMTDGICQTARLRVGAIRSPSQEPEPFLV